MCEQDADLRGHGVRVHAVTFESAQRVHEYRRQAPPSVPILRDPRRAAYRAFGFERAPVYRVWAPRTLLFYLRQLTHGRFPHRARSDRYQLGGDVLLDPAGRSVWVYRSREPADRPSVNDILKQIE